VPFLEELAELESELLSTPTQKKEETKSDEKKIKEQ
jgi:hypothetical protein